MKVANTYSRNKSINTEENIVSYLSKKLLSYNIYCCQDDREDIMIDIYFKNIKQQVSKMPFLL